MKYVKEEMKLLNMKKVKLRQFNSNSPMIFEIENELSLAEKIDFIDSQQNGIATYLIELFTKWESEKNDLPQHHGRPKTVSKKAWLRRNDIKGIINNDYKLGHYSLFGTHFTSMSITCSETENGRNMIYTGKHIGEQWFHDLLEKLYREEKVYYEDNDPFSMKLQKLRKFGDKYGVLFNSQEINDIVWNRMKDVSETNLDAYIDAYEKLEQSIKDIEIKLHDTLLTLSE